METPFPAYKGNDPYIFVSYSHEDNDAVFPEIQWLKEQGFDIWYDEGISPGSEWHQALADRIQQSSLFVYFITPQSVVSEHCEREVHYAIDNGKQLLAVHLEETELPTGLDLSLSSIQAIIRHELSDLDYRLKLLKGTSDHINRGIAQSGLEESTKSKAPLASNVLLLMGSVGIALIAGLVGWQISPTEPPKAQSLHRFPIDLPAEMDFNLEVGQPIAITPDGTRIIFTGQDVERQGALYSRALKNLDPNLILRSNGPIGGIAVSPDSEWIAYFDTTDGTIKKVHVDGGPTGTICATNVDHGQLIFGDITWGSNGTIIFATQAHPGLMQVSEHGGIAEPLTTLDAEQERHYQPFFLPDGKALLFTRGTRSHDPAETDRIALITLADTEQRELTAGSSPRLATNGHHLLFYRENAVWAASFDIDGYRMGAQAIPVQENIQYQHNAVFSMSDDGTLVYWNTSDVDIRNRNLVWVDREGREEMLPLKPQAYRSPRLSPSEDQIAMSILSDAQFDIWVYSIARGTSMRLTFEEGSEAMSQWSPDGQQLVYSSVRDGVANLFSRAVTGVGTERRLSSGTNDHYPSSWNADGLAILVTECGGLIVTCGISMVSLEDEPVLSKVLASEFLEVGGVVSPDGAWIAYSSNESGEPQVYVRPFPDVASGSRWQISADGGQVPRWGDEGGELFYWGKTHMMVVPVETTSGFEYGIASPLFELEGYSFWGGANYDVDHDGQRFLMVKGESSAHGDVVLVQNWLDELERLVPTK